jgi:hypothetical protein
MEDFLIGMAVSIILNCIKVATKNPGRAAALKAALLKIRDQINLLYPDSAAMAAPAAPARLGSQK